jgi:hypothetical protein
MIDLYTIGLRASIFLSLVVYKTAVFLGDLYSKIGFAFSVAR